MYDNGDEIITTVQLLDYDKRFKTGMIKLDAQLYEKLKEIFGGKDLILKLSKKDAEIHIKELKYG